MLSKFEILSFFVWQLFSFFFYDRFHEKFISIQYFPKSLSQYSFRSSTKILFCQQKRITLPQGKIPPPHKWVKNLFDMCTFFPQNPIFHDQKIFLPKNILVVKIGFWKQKCTHIQKDLWGGGGGPKQSSPRRHTCHFLSNYKNLPKEFLGKFFPKDLVLFLEKKSFFTKTNFFFFFWKKKLCWWKKIVFSKNNSKSLPQKKLLTWRKNPSYDNSSYITVFFKNIFSLSKTVTGGSNW